ncbi:enoyl-CoA hydratase/isomerase family protein [Rhizorhabdus wittichii]|uniref:Enoyl-CoA hydratase/isomerase family protein n=1 Tax=Rhizorhabdus wittichii TaxID=160791 RepID=A0A975HD97_9SPHN|nr:enoyl-CoA hydratase-related protein [Rhizorhabdus wittichii]QTH21195.1 enoyl-CoA hydratase/isomerase family protein [Rhizorhabdus wittichii]
MDATVSGAGEAELIVRDEGRLRIITLNRPERLNALTPELHHLLQDAVAAAAADPGVGAVALTGAGRAFCSGGDVRRSADAAEKAKVPETVEERADTLRGHGRTTLLLSQMPKPTIALVNGAAAGAGLTLALACDLRIMADDAVLRTAYARIGLSGDLGISYFLNRLVGASRAAELLFLDQRIDAVAAERLGLVNRIAPAASFAEEGMAMARALADGPSVAFRYMKQNLALAETGGLEAVIDREAYNSARCVRTQDVKEASIAFREKRPPSFTGR